MTGGWPGTWCPPMVRMPTSLAAVVREHAAARLPDYLLPSVFVVLPSSCR